MIVVMQVSANKQNVADVIARIEADGYKAHLSEGDERTVIGVVGESPTPLLEENYSTLGGVEKVVHIPALLAVPVLGELNAAIVAGLGASVRVVTP